MIVETTRLMDRWLKDTQYGLAAHLNALSRQTPEGATDPLPEVPAIYNDVEEETVVRELNPPSSPALVVFVDGDAVFPRAQKTERKVARNLRVIAAYITKDEVALKASRDGGYVLRAVMQCWSAFNSHMNSAQYRELNGIKILSIDRITITRIASDVGRAHLWGFAHAQLDIIDG